MLKPCGCKPGRIDSKNTQISLLFRLDMVYSLASTWMRADKSEQCRTVKIQNDRDPSTSQPSNDVDLAPVDETHAVGARKPEPWQYNSFNSDAEQLTQAPTRWQLLLLLPHLS
jgi:hypothetical protein